MSDRCPHRYPARPDGSGIGCPQCRGLAEARTERWLPVVGYEGLYEVSDHGRVRSLDHWVRNPRGGRRLRRGRVLKPATRDSRRQVRLSRGGEVRTRRVHQLVLEAFVGPCPPGMESLHGPAGRGCDWLTNLCYGTHAENIADMVRDGTRLFGERIPSAKLTAAIVLECRRRHAAGETQATLAREFGVGQATLSVAIRGETWAWLTGEAAA